MQLVIDNKPRTLPEDKILKTIHINSEKTWRGGDQQTLYLVRELKKLGCDSHLIAPPGSLLLERAEGEKIKCFSVRMRGEADVIAIFNIYRIIKKNNYHLVHLHTSHAHTLGFFATRLIKSKPILVVTRRVQFSIYNHSFFGLNRYKYQKWTNHIVSVSNAVKQQLIEDGVSKDKISVIHSSISPNDFTTTLEDSIDNLLPLNKNGHIVGMIGNFDRVKGQKYFIQAIPGILKEFPSTAFFIVGEGKYKKENELLVSNLNLKERVVFTGFIKNVNTLLEHFNVLVVPSLEEGINTTILAAHLLKKPVIATKVGGNTEIIRDGFNGILIPPKDKSAIEKAVVKLLRNKDMCRQFAENGYRKVIENFSADRMAKEYFKLYKKLSGFNDKIYK
ncbi:MAG: glycosyltransferase family 4 protein [Thermodesulfobacteriota bacterium]|nr:glycosyltransferase family 4 protein [Thermodesulfobacteriota bacterium]